ncbi:MAG TPA: DMT family transporter [Glaciihabitans sp.]|nr:DMT family transporter [Glaciihabitans sp.]
MTAGSVSIRAAVYMVLASLFWAGNYVLGAVAVSSMSPFDLTFLRWALAVVPLLVVAQLVEKPNWRAVLRAWPLLLLLALLGMLAYNLFLYQALNFTTPASASLVNAANPATMALLAVLLVGQKLSPRAVVGIALSLVGVVVIISHGSLDALLNLDINTGQLLMVAAIIVWSLYSIWGRLIKTVPPITATAAQAVIVLIVMSPFALINGVAFPTEVEPLSALLYIAIFPSVGSYILWNLALRTTPPAIAGIYLNLITVFTVLIGVSLGQQVTLAEIIGGLIVIGGVLLTSVPSRTPRLAAHGK